MELYCGPIIKEIMDDKTWKQGLEKKTVFQVSDYSYNYYYTV